MRWWTARSWNRSPSSITWCRWADMSLTETFRARGSTAGSEVTTRPGFDWRQYVVYIAFVIVFAVFAITLHDQGFLTHNNLLNIVSQTATISIMAVAVTFVISAAEIDLSVGAVGGLSSVMTAIAIEHLGLVPGILAGLLTGCLVGS